MRKNNLLKGNDIMEFKRIITPDDSLYMNAINLYKISFPIYEQREEKSQIEMYARMAG